MEHFGIDEDLNKSGWKTLSIIGLSTFGLFAVIILIYVVCVPSTKETIRSERIVGVIIKKYIDHREHNYQRIVITDNNKQTMIMGFEWEGLYDACEIGDTLSKEKGQTTLSLYNRSKNKVRTFHFSL